MMSMPRVPSYTQDPIYSRFDNCSSNRRTIDRINAQIDEIAAQHGYVIPPTVSRHPSTQEVRDRIATLRRAVPDLSNRENTRLDRMDLKLDDMQQPMMLASSYTNFKDTAWDGVQAGFGATIGGGVHQLGEMLRQQQAGMADDFMN